jgi:hypothetical protein
VYFLGGLECVGHSFAYVAYFVFLRDAWIRTQRAAEGNSRATNLATHLLTVSQPSLLATHLPTKLPGALPRLSPSLPSHLSPYFLATHPPT